MRFTCFKCKHNSTSPINYPCSNCGMDISHLDGTNLSEWNRKKLPEHTSLLSGSCVPLNGKDWNCSFDIEGYSKITEIVEFTLNYGQWFNYEFRNHINQVCLTFIPEIIGAGVSTHYATLDAHPVSGCCIISPKSVSFGHPFPVLKDWVATQFGGQSSICKICGNTTDLGITVCWSCYANYNNDWTKLL